MFKADVEKDDKEDLRLELENEESVGQGMAEIQETPFDDNNSQLKIKVNEPSAPSTPKDGLNNTVATEIKANFTVNNLNTDVDINDVLNSKRAT